MIYTAKNKKQHLTGEIDEIDSDLLDGRSINLNSDGYARIGNKRLNRLIMERVLGRKIKHGFVVDHINRKKLDNRRSNLREVTVLENCINKNRIERRYFGSTFLKARNKWQAQIKINGKQRYLGIFKTEKEACECYIKKVSELNQHRVPDTLNLTKEKEHDELLDTN